MPWVTGEGITVPDTGKDGYGRAARPADAKESNGRGWFGLVMGGRPQSATTQQGGGKGTTAFDF